MFLILHLFKSTPTNGSHFIGFNLFLLDLSVDSSSQLRVTPRETSTPHFPPTDPPREPSPMERVGLGLQLGRSRMQLGQNFRPLTPVTCHRFSRSDPIRIVRQTESAPSSESPFQPSLRSDPSGLLESHSPPELIPTEQRILRRVPGERHAVNRIGPSRYLFQQLNRTDSFLGQQPHSVDWSLPRKQSILREPPEHNRRFNGLQRLR